MSLFFFCKNLTGSLILFVNRATPQGVVRLLWNSAINFQLMKLNSKNYKTVSYVADVAPAVSDNTQNTMSLDSERGVNPSKTELVLFQ